LQLSSTGSTNGCTKRPSNWPKRHSASASASASDFELCNKFLSVHASDGLKDGDRGGEGDLGTWNGHGTSRLRGNEEAAGGGGGGVGEGEGAVGRD